MRLGKDKQVFLLTFFILFSASVSGQAEKSFKYQLNGNLQKNNVITTDHSLLINYSISEINVKSIANDNGTFYRVSIPGHVPTSTTGKPELPVYSRLISIPEGSDYKLKISEVKSSRINPSGKNITGVLFPVQEGETKEIQQKKPAFLIDKAAYATRGLISSDTVRIESLGTVRNKKLANLYISPIRYNPQLNVIEVITSMKVEIIFSSPGKIDSKSLYPESALINESLTKGVLNYNPEDVIPGFSDQPVRMVILTDSSFRKHLEPFLRWKTQKGYKVQVLYKGEGLAGNSYTELKDTLSKIYHASSETEPPPEYLLIIGDINRVPYYGMGGTGNVTDMYYGEFDGNGDYIPEMFIGRLPVADTTELKTVIDKIIQYEKFDFVPTNTFYSQAIATAGYDAGYANLMNGQVKYSVTNYLTTANKINEYHFYYPQSYTAKDSIIKLINKGVSFINYSGHGDATGWLHLNIKVPDIPSFLNDKMYPFIISNACKTAQFSNNSSFGNKLVVTNKKGAIGFIGCSNDSYWDEDFYYAVGTGPISADPTYEGSGLGFYDRLFHTHNEPASDWYFTMGQINYAGNLAVSASTTFRKKYYWETYNLVGDPSVIPLLRRPDSFNISLPDTLPNGINSLSLTIQPFSYVAVSHFDTLWDASFSSPSGSVVLEMPGLTDDSCMIVITGQNKIPLIKTIYFSDINKEYIYLTSTSINDSQGNGNGLADFGETIFLNLKISNLGLTDAHNLYAKISSPSNWISIINDSVSIGTLAAKSDIVLDNDFEITISDDAPNKGVATINLVLKDLTSEKHFTIDIIIHAPELEIISCIMDDTILGNGNFIADPGETFSLIFKVLNQGNSDISGQFYVTSPNAGDINILDPSVKSGILKFGEIIEIPVTVKLSETVQSGNFISIATILDCNPYIVNRDFTFRVGKIRESFEAESFKVFPWINISSKPWTITGTNSYDGIVSARSGAIQSNGTTSLMIKTVFGTADTVKFFYKVSSELNYDHFSFKLNDNEIITKSGELPWTKQTVAVPAGLNKMEWIYHKDGNIDGGTDCAWIDMIDFAGSGSVTYIQKDLKVAKIESPVQKEDIGKELVIVKVLNVGPDTINGFSMAYSINNKEPHTQFFPKTVIPFGDSVSVTFNLKADFSIFGNYDFEVYGFNNADDYLINDTIKISLQNNDLNDTVGIYDHKLNSNINVVVFPNPFAEELKILIDCDRAGTVNYSLINVSGMKIMDFRRDVYPGENLISINSSRLIPSVYYLYIEFNGGYKTIPVIKTKH